MCSHGEGEGGEMYLEFLYLQSRTVVDIFMQHALHFCPWVTSELMTEKILGCEMWLQARKKTVTERLEQDETEDGAQDTFETRRLNYVTLTHIFIYLFP